MSSPRVVAIVPTYNEPDELRAVVESLEVERYPALTIVVVNAGEPLPSDIIEGVEEITVPKDFFWTACVQRGIERCRELSPDFVYLTNADTPLTPGTLSTLVSHASSHSKTVVCTPAYSDDDRLIYAYQSPMGFLLYGRLVRPWQSRDQAHREPQEIGLTGGQGVLVPMEALRNTNLDTARFPHYASDHDLWLTLRKSGYRLVLVPGTGVINTRAFGTHGSTNKAKALWRRMTSPMLPESWPTMWRLRRKHLPLLVAVVSTLVSFAMRWTIGLPKILKRL